MSSMAHLLAYICQFNMQPVCGMQLSPTLPTTHGSGGGGGVLRKPLCTDQTREPIGTPETLWEHIAHSKTSRLEVTVWFTNVTRYFQSSRGFHITYSRKTGANLRDDPKL